MKNKVNTLTVAECAYIAGIVDGEGNLAIGKSAPNKGSGEINIRYLPYLKIGNTDPHLLIWIQERVGYGTVYREGRFWFDDPKRKPFYTWHISNKQLDRLLEQIYPYLVVKKKQAEIIFEIRKTIDLTRSTRDGISSEILAKRQECFEALKHEHHRRWLPDSCFDMP